MTCCSQKVWRRCDGQTTIRAGAAKHGLKWWLSFRASRQFDLNEWLNDVSAWCKLDVLRDGTSLYFTWGTVNQPPLPLVTKRRVLEFQSYGLKNDCCDCCACTEKYAQWHSVISICRGDTEGFAQRFELCAHQFTLAFRVVNDTLQLKFCRLQASQCSWRETETVSIPICTVSLPLANGVCYLRKRADMDRMRLAPLEIMCGDGQKMVLTLPEFVGDHLHHDGYAVLALSSVVEKSCVSES